MDIAVAVIRAGDLLFQATSFVDEEEHVLPVPPVDGSIVPEIFPEHVAASIALLREDIDPILVWLFVDMVFPRLIRYGGGKQDEIASAGQQSDEFLRHALGQVFRDFQTDTQVKFFIIRVLKKFFYKRQPGQIEFVELPYFSCFPGNMRAVYSDNFFGTVIFKYIRPLAQAAADIDHAPDIDMFQQKWNDDVCRGGIMIRVVMMGNHFTHLICIIDRICLAISLRLHPLRLL